MRLLLTIRPDGPDPYGTHALIVDGAKPTDQARYVIAALRTPDEVLVIPNARLHLDGPVSTATVRAGRIMAVKAL